MIAKRRRFRLTKYSAIVACIMVVAGVGIAVGVVSGWRGNTAEEKEKIQIAERLMNSHGSAVYRFTNATVTRQGDDRWKLDGNVLVKDPNSTFLPEYTVHLAVELEVNDGEWEIGDASVFGFVESFWQRIERYAKSLLP